MATVSISGRLPTIGEVEKINKENGEVFEVLEFSVAESDYDFSKGESITNWWDCRAYNGKATAIKSNLTKGDGISIIGKLKKEEWIDKTTQLKRSRVVVLVEKMVFFKIDRNEKNVVIEPEKIDEVGVY